MNFSRYANRLIALAGLALLLAAGAGCSGINATKSVSPLDFILPGYNFFYVPPATSGTNAAVVLAQLN
jgi:hypothetical protein